MKHQCGMKNFRSALHHRSAWGEMCPSFKFQSGLGVVHFSTLISPMNSIPFKIRINESSLTEAINPNRNSTDSSLCIIKIVMPNKSLEVFQPSEASSVMIFNYNSIRLLTGGYASPEARNEETEVA